MKYKLNRDFIIKKETEKRFMLMNVVSGTVYSINSRIAHLLNAKDLNAFSSSEKSFLLREITPKVVGLQIKRCLAGMLSKKEKIG